MKNNNNFMIGEKMTENRTKIISNIYNVIKKISISRLIFSSVFALALFYMSKIVFLGYVDNENYIEVFYFSEYSILFLLIPIIYAVLYFIEKYYAKGIEHIIGYDNSKCKKALCIISAVLLLVVYAIYFLTFYPGGIYIDTWTSFEMLTGAKEFTSQQPVLYTVILNIVKLLMPDYYTGFAIITAVQIILMISVLTYFIYWILDKGVNPIIAFFTILFFAFFKLYPLYSVSVWKDTPFSLVLLLLTLSIIDIVLESNKNKINISTIVKFNISAALVIFLRSNGMYLIIISAAVLVLCFIRKNIKENIANFITFVISLLVTIVLCIIIQHSFVLFGIKKTPEIGMTISVPIQQVARVVAVDGNITEEQKELIEKVVPIKTIKSKYRALLVDRIKWDTTFNEKYLVDHLSDYFKLWFELLLQNPSEYFKSYLLQTSGFWTFNVVGEEAYQSAVTWETLNHIAQNKNIIADNTNFDFKENILAIEYYSGGFFFWITALSAFITFRLCEKKYLIGYIAPIALWLTVMVATPMGQALRYVYILVLILPLNLIYPAMFAKKNSKEEI